MKTLIIYHSGVGNTKIIANMLYNQLKNKTNATIKSIEEISSDFEIGKFDNYIIGFPTYHSSPSPSILRYLESINPLTQNKPAYIFTTCGWYSTNTLRIFAKRCLDKNIMPVMCCSYRCPATDGTLIAPNMKIWFKFEKDIQIRIEKETYRIMNEFLKKQYNVKLPRFKFYSIINYPNKLGGHFYKPMIYIHKSRCIKCGKCIEDCPSNCFLTDQDNFPSYKKENCEHCYRCIHHCPVQALSLNKNKIVRKQLNNKFFNDLNYIN